MPNEFDWNQFPESPSAVADPQFAQNPDLGLLNSMFGGQLAQAAPTWTPPPHDWNQYPTEAPPQSYEEQINQTQQELDKQAQEDQQARQAAEQAAQEARRAQIERTRARLQAEDAARAQQQQDENFNPETGATQPSANESLNPAEEALLGAGQGAAEVGRQIGGMVRAAGARETGKTVSDYWTEQARQYADAGQADPTATTGKIINWLASSAVGMAPIVAGGAVAGPAGVAAVMGAQSFGGTYQGAMEAYQQQGDSEEQAAKKAYIPAIFSGAVSAAIGHAVGPTGLGALGSKALAGDTIGKIVGTIAKDMGLGGVQGFTDTLAQGIIQKATFNPNKTWAEIVPEALQSAGGGAVLGGLASSVHQGLGVLARKATAEVPPAESTPAAQPELVLPRVVNPTIPTPEVQLNVPNVAQPEAIPVQARSVAETPRVVQLPKIEVPEPVAQAVDAHLINDPAAAPELAKVVDAATADHPAAKFYDQLPDSIDTSTPKAVAEAESALQAVVTKIEGSDLSPQEKADGIAPITQILTDLKPNESTIQNPSEAVTPAQATAVEHSIGLRPAEPVSPEAGSARPDTGNGNATPPARVPEVRPETSSQPAVVSEPVRQAEAASQLTESQKRWADLHTESELANGTTVDAIKAVRAKYPELVLRRGFEAYQKDRFNKSIEDLKSGVGPAFALFAKELLRGNEKAVKAVDNASLEGVPLTDAQLAVERAQNLPAQPGKGGETNGQRQNEKEKGKQESLLTQPVAPTQTETAPLKPTLSRAGKVKKSASVSRVEPIAPEPLTKAPSKSTIKPTEQKKYLLGEVDRLIKEAPDKTESHFEKADANNDIADLDAIIKGAEGSNPGIRTLGFYEGVQNAALSLFKKYDVPPRKSEDVAGRIADLKQEMERARYAQLPHVTISVPGDGEFSIINSKEALKAFKERAARFPTTTPKASAPSNPSTNPKSAGAVTKNPDHSDYAAAAAFFHSDDEYRPILQHAVSNGHEMVATDGRKMIVIKGKFGGTKKEPVFIDAKGKEIKDITIKGSNKNPDEIKTPKDFPDYKQVIPTDVAPLLRGASTEELFNLARQAEMIFNKDDVNPSLTLVMNPDGTLGFKSATKRGSLQSKTKTEQWNPADYQHNVQDGAKPITSLNLEYVQEIMTALRRIGNDKVDIYHKDELSPVVFKTKNADVILMPMRMAALGEPTPEPSAQRPLQKATGIEPIKELLADPNNGLDEDSRKVALALMNDPKLAPMLEGRKLIIADRLDKAGRMQGVAAVKQMVIGLSRAAEPDVFVHEAFHGAWDGISERDKTAFEEGRQRLIRMKYGDNSPLLKGMDSTEFQRSGISPKDYSLSSTEEFAMWALSHEFADRQLNPEARTIIVRLREWVKALIDTVAKALGRPANWEQSVRNILDGKFDPSPELTAKAEGLKASFVQTAEEAKNAALLARNQEDRSVEGKHFLASQFDIHEALMRHGAGTASDKAKRLLGLADKEGIVRQGIDLHGAAEGYRAIKAQTPEPDAQLRNARFAAASFEAEDAAQRERQAKADEALKEISSPSFVKKTMAADLAELNMTTKEQAIQTAKSVLASKVQLAKELATSKGLSDIERATLEGQLKEVSEAQRSSSALSGLVSDMTKVLASTPEGLKLLENGASRNDFRRIYRDLKNSTGQPLHSESLMNWASYLLEKAPDLRQKLLALQMSSDPNIRTGIQEFERKFVEAYRKDPVKAVSVEFGKAVSLGTNAAKAKFVWQTLNEPLIRKVKNYVETNQAAEIGAKALNDPAIVDLRKEIRTDAKFIGDNAHESAKVFDPSSTVITPSGKTVDMSLKEISGDSFNRLRTEGVAAVREMKDWLSTNEPGTANYEYYRRSVQAIEESLLAGSVLHPNDPLKVWNHTFGILQNVANTSGGRISNAWKPFLAKYQQISQRAQHWTTKWMPETINARIAAIRSQGIKYGSFGKKLNLDRANDTIWPELNELAWSGNRQAGPLEVGDRIGINGRVVTKEYLAAVKSQSEAAKEGFKAAGPDQTTVDTIAGKNAAFEREAHPTGPYGVPRTHESDAAGFADEMGKGYKAFIEAKKANDDGAKAKALSQMEDAFSQNFERHAKAFTQDREFGIVGDNITPLDGEEGAFAAVWPKIEDGSVQTSLEYFNALAEVSGYSVPEVKEIVLPEFGRMADKWNGRYQDELNAAKLVGGTQETKNAFSRSRNEAVAPYSMYRYGFKDANAVKGFGSSIYARAFDTARNGLNAVIADLKRVQADRDKKIMAERAKGNYAAEKSVVAQQRRDRDMDKSYDDYHDIERRLRLAQSMADMLDRTAPTSTPEGKLLRMYQNLVGSSLGTSAAFGDIVMNPLFLGRSIHRVTGSYSKMAGLGLAAHLESNLRAALSLVVSPLKAGLYNVFLADPSESLLSGGGRLSGGLVGAIKHIPEDRSLAIFANRALVPVIRELADNMHTRFWSHDKMVEHGIDPSSNIVEDISNRLLGGLAQAGKLSNDPATHTGLFDRAIHTGLGMFEVAYKALSGSVYRLNDTVMNQSIKNLFADSLVSKWGPIAQYEKAAKMLAVRVKEGRRPWDSENFDNPINDPSPKEMLNVFHAGPKDKLNVIEAHDRAGIDYRKKLWEAVNAYAYGDGKHEMYSEAERYKMAQEMMIAENKQTRVNESQLLRDNGPIARLVKPYQSWSTRQLSNFWKMTETAVAATKGLEGRQAQVARALAYVGAASTLVAFLGYAALVKTQGDMLRRPFQKALYNQVTASKLPWERQGAGGAATGWALAAANSIPYLGNIANAMFDDLPSRAAYDPSVAMVEKAKTIGQYIGGAVQTGDPTYRLAETVGSIIPDTKIISNRLESQSGKRENINAANLYRRYADPETVKAMGAGSFQATPLTPYAAKMVNAAVNGNTAELQRLHDEAVQVATALGKADPEKAVSQAYRNQQAEVKALKQKQTPEQRDAFLSKLSPSERAILDNVEANFGAGAQAIGMNAPSPTKQPKGQGGGSLSRGARLTTGPGRLGGGRGPRVRGTLSRTKKQRLARIKTGRRSVARYGARRRAVA